MGDKKGWSFKLPKNIPKGVLKKDQLLIVFLVGVLLLVIALPGGSKENQKSSSLSTDATDRSQLNEGAYVRNMERHLEELLSDMAGVGDVTVMITLRSSAEKVVEKDTEAESEHVTETDSQGGSRTTQSATHGEATVYDGSSKENSVPYISKEISPQAEGVVVLASGGDDANVVKNITEAVQALFGIDTHKIRIMKKN